MDLDRRDRLDLALVGLALVLVFTTFVDVSGAGATVGGVIDAIASVGPIAYLFVFAAGGVLFLVYGLLYLPSRENRGG
jgi:hypothetical protein